MCHIRHSCTAKLQIWRGRGFPRNTTTSGHDTPSVKWNKHRTRGGCLATLLHASHRQFHEDNGGDMMITPSNRVTLISRTDAQTDTKAEKFIIMFTYAHHWSPELLEMSQNVTQGLRIWQILWKHRSNGKRTRHLECGTARVSIGQVVFENTVKRISEVNLGYFECD
jgi:hypothetical protein